MLDLPANADWVLIACWVDRTCMRNALAYRLGRDFGRWAPALRWVEVSINGEYRGLYQLVEAIRTSKHRLDLNRPAATAKLGDITGDYVFRREHAGKHSGSPTVVYDWISPTRDADGYRHIFTYHYPRHDDLTDQQRRYLHGFVAKFETQMYAAVGSVSDVANIIDMATWVDYALVTEYANEVDGWMKSVYFVKPSDRRDARLQLTPLWDYNLAFGQLKHRGGHKTGVWQHKAANRHHLGCTPQLPVPPGCDRCSRGLEYDNLPFVPQWASQLFADPQFRAALGCRWQEMRAGVLSDAVVQAKLRRWHARLAPAMRRHFGRWPELLEHREVRHPAGRTPELAAVSPLADLVGPHGRDSADLFAEEVAWMAEWIRRRGAWLDDHMPACVRTR